MNSVTIESLFRYDHLPEELQKISKPFHDQAIWMLDNLPQSRALTKAFWKLWEAKNLSVFAYVSNGDV